LAFAFASPKGAANRLVVVALGKEPRRPQHDDGQAVLGVDELAQILGGRLGHAVDVPRRGATSSVTHAAGWRAAGVSARRRRWSCW